MAALPSNVTAQAERALSLARKFAVFGEPGYAQTIAALEAARSAVEAASSISPSSAQYWITQLTNVIAETNAAELQSGSRGGEITSAGQTVIAAQAARDNGASAQDPPVPVVTGGANSDDAAPSNSANFSNADRFVPDSDIGTDGRIRTTTETQATPPGTNSSTSLTSIGGANPSDEENVTDLGEIVITAAREPGAGAASDDGTTAGIIAAGATDQSQLQVSGSNAITTLVNKTARPIVPRPNVLDRYSSYTYSISIYLMSPDDYSRLLTTKKRFIPGYQLLMQSGGAPGNVTQTSVDTTINGLTFDSGNTSKGRNQFFPLDYYLDDVEVKSVIHGKGTNAAHNVVELKFKITEPNGITLLDNLYKAVQNYVTVGGGASKATAAANYAAQNYLMVIRYYGYDENGNIAKPLSSTGNRSDTNAILEKFIPFQFSGIKFRISNRLTEYSCEAVCPQNAIATSQGRGVIPFNIELTATTLQNLFSGNETWTATKNRQQTDRTQQSPVTAPSNAAAAPDVSLATGLAQALNKYQAELVKQGTYEVADVYKIIISHPELANASIVPPTITDLKTKPMTQATTAAQAIDTNAQTVNTRAKTVSATAGMSLTQFIDLAVRSSDYVYKQQNKIIDQNGKEIPQGAGAKAFAWYRIGTQAKPLKQDNKRNDTAYEITYEIAPYGINDIKSDYFPKGVFRGAQKRYAYWFTGENTSVLNFEQDFNYLYYITINSRTRATVSSRGTADYREIEKRLFSPNSPQTNQGLEGDANEPGANAADYLYSPGDQSRVKLTILGDPAWIEQGEVWSGVRSTGNSSNESTDVYFDAFLSDDTINFDSREALFEVSFNKPADYNLSTGVIDLKGTGGAATQTYIYKAVTVVSNFRKGSFTQDLEGVMLVFPDSVTTTKKLVEQNGATNQGASSTDSRNQPDESAAETARLARLAGAAGSLTPSPEVVYTDPMGSDDGSAIMNAVEERQRLSPPPTPVGATLPTDVGVYTDASDGIVRDE